MKAYGHDKPAQYWQPLRLCITSLPHPLYEALFLYTLTIRKFSLAIQFPFVNKNINLRKMLVCFVALGVNRQHGMVAKFRNAAAKFSREEFTVETEFK